MAFRATDAVGASWALVEQISGKLVGRCRSIHEVPQRPRFSALSRSALPSTAQLSHLSFTTFRTTKMAHTNSFNTIDSYNKVWNNCTITDGRSQLLAWLSPLEPRLQHQDIRDRRVKDVGGWVLQTEEFRSWAGNEGGESDDAVLFCCGNPGVGKTYIW